MRVRKAARRYARALYELADEAGILPQILADIAALDRAAAESPELRNFLGRYVLPRSVRLRTLERLLAGQLHPLTWRFVRLVERKRRLGLLADIAYSLRELRDAAAGLVPVAVTLAAAAAEPAAGRVAERIGARLGRPIRLAVSVDPALLGGFILRIGDELHDLSAAGALRAFRARALTA